MESSIFDNADARAAKTGDSLMLSEFGATDDTSTLERIAADADRHMTSWQEWHYCGCDDPTTQGPGDVQALVKDPSKPPRGSNVFWGKLKALARPYPQAIAGTPIRWSFNPATRKFELVYTTQRADGHGRFERGTTRVFVPKIQYPDGFRVRVTGASTSREASSASSRSPHARPRQADDLRGRRSAQYGGSSSYQSPSIRNDRQKRCLAPSSSSEASMSGT